MMTCHDMQQWLSAYVDGQLQQSQRSQLEVHLATCAACQTELASLRSMLDTLHSLKQPQAPDLLSGIHARLSRKPVWQRFAQRFLAPWPQSLPWHGLALAMSAMLVIIVSNHPIPAKSPQLARLLGDRISGQDVAQYGAYYDRDAEIPRREAGVKHAAILQAKDQLRTNEPLKQLAEGRSFGGGAAGRPAESVNGALGLSNTESVSAVDHPATLESPVTQNESIRQLAKISELDEIRSDEWKMDQKLPEAPAAAAAPVGVARFAAATGDTSAVQWSHAGDTPSGVEGSAVGEENLRAKTATPPVWSLEVAPEDQTCNVDSDCVIVSTGCSSCECGSPANRTAEQRYIERYKTMCMDYHGGVCDYVCPTPYARCLDHRCTLSASKPTQ